MLRQFAGGYLKAPQTAGHHGPRCRLVLLQFAPVFWHGLEPLASLRSSAWSWRPCLPASVTRLREAQFATRASVSGRGVRQQRPPSFAQLAHLLPWPPAKEPSVRLTAKLVPALMPPRMLGITAHPRSRLPRRAEP